MKIGCGGAMGSFIPLRYTQDDNVFMRMQLELSVDRIEEERVVLIDQDQNVFVWPKAVLPDAHEGQLIFLDISFNKRDQKTPAPDVAAKDILNEILKIE